MNEAVLLLSNEVNLKGLYAGDLTSLFQSSAFPISVSRPLASLSRPRFLTGTVKSECGLTPALITDHRQHLFIFRICAGLPRDLKSLAKRRDDRRQRDQNTGYREGPFPRAGD